MGWRFAFSYLTQNVKDILVTSPSDAVEDVLRFGLGTCLHIAHELAHLSTLCLEDLISAAKSGPATLAFLRFIQAFRTQCLAA